MRTIFLTHRISMMFMLLFQLTFIPLRYKRKTSVLIVLGCLMITDILDYVELICQLGNFRVIFTVLETILVQATALVLCRYRDGRAIFVGFTSAAYVLVGNMIAFILLAHQCPAWMAIGAQIIIHSVVMVIFYINFRAVLQQLMEHAVMNWLYFCPIPGMFYMVLYSLCVWPGDILRTPENGVTIALVLAMMIIVYNIIAHLFDSARKEMEHACDLEFLNMQTKNFKMQMELLQQKNAETAIWRHDLRHTFSLIRGLASSGDTDRLLDYLNKENEELDHLTVRNFCSNVTINSILSNCDAKAKQLGVTLQCQVMFPEHLDSHYEFELAAVLSNLLENAITAASQEAPDETGTRWVHVSMKTVKNQLFIEVVNLCSHEVPISGESGLPVSNQGEGHGFGMRSVKAYAQKYRAVFRYQQSGNQFRAQFLVPLQDQTT